MTSTNLAYIDERAEGAVARYPTVTATMRAQAEEAARLRIAGLAVYNHDVEEHMLDTARNKRRAWVRGYREQCTALRRRLAERGIEPLAVLPKAAWERLCKESGLYLLSPDSDSRVGISTKKIDEFDRKAKRAVGWRIVAYCFAPCSLIWLSFMLGGMPWQGALRLGFLMPFVGCICIGFLAGTLILALIPRSSMNIPEEPVFGTIYKRATRRMIRKWAQSHEQIVRDFFPDGISLRPDPGPSAHLVLPNPPESVAAKLWALKDLPLKVAAVADAIAFLETPEEILLKEAAARAEAWAAELRELLRFDPIIYIEEGAAVAVIDQFGEFPMEQEVVDRVLGAEFLP